MLKMETIDLNCTNVVEVCYSQTYETLKQGLKLKFLRGPHEEF